MTVNTYDIGDVVVLTATFAVDGTPTNPSTIACQVKDPNGTETTPTPTNPSSGVYEVEVEPTTAGLWHYRFAGTGGAKAAEEHAFEVRRSAFL